MKLNLGHEVAQSFAETLVQATELDFQKFQGKKVAILHNKERLLRDRLPDGPFVESADVGRVHLDVNYLRGSGQLKRRMSCEVVIYTAKTCVRKAPGFDGILVANKRDVRQRTQRRAFVTCVERVGSFQGVKVRQRACVIGEKGHSDGINRPSVQQRAERQVSVPGGCRADP